MMLLIRSLAFLGLFISTAARAGEPPFQGETPKQMLQNIMETPLDMRPLSPVAGQGRR